VSTHTHTHTHSHTQKTFCIFTFSENSFCVIYRLVFLTGTNTFQRISDIAIPLCVCVCVWDNTSLLFSSDFDKNRCPNCWKRPSLTHWKLINGVSISVSIENIIIYHRRLPVCVCVCVCVFLSLSVMSGITHCCRDAQSCVFLSFKAPVTNQSCRGSLAPPPLTVTHEQASSLMFTDARSVC